MEWDRRIPKPNHSHAWRGTWNRPMYMDENLMHPFIVARMTDHNVKATDRDDVRESEINKRELRRNSMEVQNQLIGNRKGHELEIIPALETTGMIAVYDTHEAAEAAINQIQVSGFDMKKLSIVGRDFQTEENIIGFYNIGDRTKYWGKLGAFWGGIWGLLFGSALFIIPGVGPIIIAGTFISTLVGAAEGAVFVGGLSALGAALFSLGIPKNSIVKYETALKAGKYVMIAHGTTDDLNKAREIVKNGARDFADFDSNTLNQEARGVTH